MRSSVLYLATFLVIVMSLGSNAFAYKETNVEVKDPLESVNRAIFGFNKVVDNILLKPVAKTYRFVVPELGRKGIRNVLTNLSEPVTFVNSVLQGDMENSVNTFWRFTVNSTWGIGGIFDIGDKHGLPRREEDFGQTLGTMGAKEGGMYLMLPILGPSNGRDLVGRVVDVFSDPFTYTTTYFTVSRSVADGIDTREKLLDLTEEIDRTSLDPYSTIRSLYTQKRIDDIENGH